MNVSRESVLALQRHYVGALSKPVTAWLEELPATRLAFSGPAIRVDGEGCLLDFGAVESPLTETRAVRVFRPGKTAVSVRIAETPAWLRAESTSERNGAVVVVQITDESEGERDGTLSFWTRDELGARLETLRVRVDARPRQPSASISFNGQPSPSAFEFGDDEVYTLSVANRNSVPLVVSFSDLPAWLELASDGCSRCGPIYGPFFERTAPFTISLTPRLAGCHEGSLRMQTNDRRPDLRHLELRFSATVAPVRPNVRALPKPPLTLPVPRRNRRPELIAALAALLLLVYALLAAARGWS